MEFQSVIESTPACRLYRSDPVPDDVLRRILDAARFAPTGGNRQPVRLIAVRDAGLRQQLADLYLPLWKRFMERYAKAGVTPATSRMIANSDVMAENLAHVPVLIVVCAVLGDVLATDRQLDRLSIVGGASVYPAVQNLMLKARDEGLGTALTTLLCYVEADVKKLLSIPDDVSTAAMLPLGYPAQAFPKRVYRRPLSGIAFSDRFGSPL
jgi:nitroreductase